MNELDRPTTNFVFFLKLQNRMPASYFRLSSWLAKFKITLIPITPRELPGLEGNGKRRIIVVFCPDLNSYKNYLIFRHQYLDFALGAGKFQVVDVGSFGPLKNAHKYNRKKCYNFIQLPVRLEAVVKEVVMMFYSEHSEYGKWPGGRRAKLPGLEN